MSREPTPDEAARADAYMRNAFVSLTDRLMLDLREAADTAREFGEGIRLVEEAFDVDLPEEPK